MIRGILFSEAPPAVRGTGWLVLRVVAGLSLALAHGLGKLPPAKGFVDGVAGMGFPAPIVFAWAAGLAEFLGGLLLAAGFLTRVGAFFIAFTMGTAFFVFHAGDPFGDKERALLFLCIAIAFLISGAGRWSIDAFLSRDSSNR